MDIGGECASTTIDNQYGSFEIPRLVEGENIEIDCQYDNDPVYVATFTCQRNVNQDMFVDESYHCFKTENTDNISALANNTVKFSLQLFNFNII